MQHWIKSSHAEVDDKAFPVFCINKWFSWVSFEQDIFDIFDILIQLNWMGSVDVSVSNGIKLVQKLWWGWGSAAEQIWENKFPYKLLELAIFFTTDPCGTDFVVSSSPLSSYHQKNTCYGVLLPLSIWTLNKSTCHRQQEIIRLKCICRLAFLCWQTAM